MKKVLTVFCMLSAWASFAGSSFTFNGVASNELYNLNAPSSLINCSRMTSSGLFKHSIVCKIEGKVLGTSSGYNAHGDLGTSSFIEFEGPAADYLANLYNNPNSIYINIACGQLASDLSIGYCKLRLNH